MMQLDVLRAELERSFELNELISLTRDVLGFDPESVGGTKTLGSFAGALVDHCLAADAVEALADALQAARSDLDVSALRNADTSAELRAGTQVGPYTIIRKLGGGRLGTTYVARLDQREVRLKVLKEEATRDRRGLHRYLTATRLAGQVAHPTLPQLIEAGLVDGRYVVAHEHVEGQPLGSRVSRTGPMHINEARPLLRAVLESLAALHGRRVAHGDLSLDNIVTYRTADGDAAVLLLDVGSDRLRAAVGPKRTGLSSTGGSPKTVSPEQIRGADPTPRSDVYSFGAALYELLSGKPAFGEDVLDAAFGHLKEKPTPPSSVAPRGWIPPELDEFVLRLLSKEPSSRPSSATELLEVLDRLGRGGAGDITPEEVDSLEQALLGAPDDIEVAVQLEGAVDRGASPERIGQAFRLAATMIDDPAYAEQKSNLLFRAARLFEASNSTLEKAETVYEELLALDPRNRTALAGLEEVRRRAGKYEELVEMLLMRAEAAESARERARAMAEIGRIYARELDDKEQAVVAYTQAYCDEPTEERYADEIERLAGSNENVWGEVFASVGEIAQNPNQPQEIRNQLLLRVADWYGKAISRPDLALPCLQTVLATEPSNERALVGLTNIYRKSQQWAELGMILTKRADAAATPARRRDLRTEAAEILEHQMGDTGGARLIYEEVLAEDPSHVASGDALARIYEKTADFDALVRLLDHRAEAQRGHEKIRTICRIAEAYEDRLGDPDEAVRRYQGALEEDPQSLDALRGLERVYGKAGKYQELTETLETQLRVAATPKQRIGLLERIAAVYEEEFLDHNRAASALERALEIDPGRLSAMAALARHYRVLDRWEEASALYERQLQLVEDPSERVSLAMAWGRVLTEQIGSPERATHAYELVLQVAPEHSGALEALAKLRESSGDADAALEAIMALADQASSPEARGEQLVRAAKLLEQRGDRDGAIDYFTQALETNPNDRGTAALLRSAYVARGDTNAAVRLLEQELEVTEGERAKARLGGELARLLRDKLKDTHRAERAAKQALQYDATNRDALLVLGNVAFEDGRYVEASAHYGRLAERADSLDQEEAVRILVRYVDALSRSGSTEAALAPMDTLLRLAPDDAGALARVAFVTFEHGSPARAAELLSGYLARFGHEMSDEDRGLETYRLGESLRRMGDTAGAIAKLEEATDLDPGLAEPLESLAQAYADLQNWNEVIRAKSRHLDLADGDERVQLLVETGEIASTQLNDRTLAAKSYVAALEERPDDRKLLGKLMQLYSEEKDWNKLVDVVLKLADFVDEPAQKVKYLHTAAMVTARQIGDTAQAAEYFDQVLRLDPKNLKALKEAIELQRGAGNFPGVEELLQRRLHLALDWGDDESAIQAYDELGTLYQVNFGDIDRAIECLEAAFEKQPDNRQRNAQLAALYETNPTGYLDKAVHLQEANLRENPYRQDAYKALRKLYTANRDADASWCLCQTQTVLQLAEPDEERFYNRMRSETAAPAQAAFEEEDWMQLVMHEEASPLLTALFSLIEPAVIASRSQPLENLGFTPQHQIDPATHPAPLAQTLHYAAGVLGMPAPACFENTNDQGGLSFLHTPTPCLVLGRVGLSSQVPGQAAAFVAARQLAYYRPAMYLRHFISTGTGLKSWLFAAIKLTAPQFPVAADLEGPVNEALHALQGALASDVKEHLSSIVSKLIQSGASLDLKRWMAAIDLTADRAGLVLAHDLETAVEVVRATEEGTVAVTSQDRFRELVLYSVSAKFFALRRKLGITVDF